MNTADRTGEGVVRLEGRAKVTGAARYAVEHPLDGCLHAWPVPAGIARGRITAIDTERALAEPGTVAVLSHENAPRLGEPEDPELFVLQSPRVAYRGQYVALAVAETPQAARAAAAAVRLEYAAEPHDVTLTGGHPGLYAPETVNGGYPTDRERGDFDMAFAASEFRLDTRYRIPPLHNHPMEPHASTAVWEGPRLRVYDSAQGAHAVQSELAALFGLEPERITVVSEHVGGGFGSKGTPRPQVVLACLAARETGRPVKLAVPRHQMAQIVGHRAATEQRVRIGADGAGQISALAHEVVTYSSTVREFTEQAATPSRTMYASPHSRTTHRVTRLDVPTPSWMRAPGECPGMFALESAMDELAVTTGIDPVEIRLRNDTAKEPDSGHPFSSRRLADCLREGARRFGWEGRDPRPGTRAEGRLLIGTGVAASGYPVYVAPARATARAEAAGGYRIEVDATDIGTGARTVLAQIAAEALAAPLDRIRIGIGNSDLPKGPVAGGSMGTASWGWAVHKACRALLRTLAEHSGPLPEEGLSAHADTSDDVAARSDAYARRAFGAQFAEVQVDMDTGETRLRRLLGVFAAGRVLNARTARSQFIGGMTMGVSMALTEHSTMDAEFGDFAERDLAMYHVAVNADVPDVQAYWLDEEDQELNPMGSKGIGEIGIVGTAAAVTSAVHHATGVRVRELPVLPESLLPGLAEWRRPAVV
ncbi:MULTISPECIES: xanthine dehydrogenase family protein molybdopterin-binding subunit [Streptomyces]|uniref:Xanthine dehydrogenase family protein molybdopterin-binding subunit n=1 Tax=Streptomyces lycii TaxID=2654337 RepID=A0ABQ7FJY7_9ACTN|nr:MULTISPECIES: xanthine dehydrogenase family protein molybdopterin-binding subunit [Streptomyces]KAF4408674.1 xanthine dehydrogenase family protein molybdopterin-binding subunit [Streptomyces lycii]PGH49654.1 xanthine dehydrogenase [Streptomyces sp. Ru87]